MSAARGGVPRGSGRARCVPLAAAFERARAVLRSRAFWPSAVGATGIPRAHAAPSRDGLGGRRELAIDASIGLGGVLPLALRLAQLPEGQEEGGCAADMPWGPLERGEGRRSWLLESSDGRARRHRRSVRPAAHRPRPGRLGRARVGGRRGPAPGPVPRSRRGCQGDVGMPQKRQGRAPGRSRRAGPRRGAQGPRQECRGTPQPGGSSPQRQRARRSRIAMASRTLDSPESWGAASIQERGVAAAGKERRRRERMRGGVSRRRLRNGRLTWDRGRSDRRRPGSSRARRRSRSCFRARGRGRGPSTSGGRARCLP